MKNTVVVDILGGPGAGKSTTRAGVFHKLKMEGYNVEEVPEFAKDLTWEKRTMAINCQAYVFGKQYRGLHRLFGQVDAIITDGSVLLSCLYATSDYPPSFYQFVRDMYAQMDTMTYYIERRKLYSSIGRRQSYEEALLIDDQVLTLLRDYKIPYISIPPEADAVLRISYTVMQRLGLK